MATKRAPKASTKKAPKKSPARARAEDDGACLLDYLPSTYPVPIQTGAGQTPAQAVLNTAALPGAGKTVYCNQVVIAVPVGSDPGDIFAANSPTASTNTGKWSITSMEVKKGSELWLNDDIDYATFTFECRDRGDYLINYNLVFGVSGAVAPVASQCTVQIMENSGTTSNPADFTSKTGSYTITTSTPQFYLTNFTAYATGSPTVPATEFFNGADINFAWESNGTFFQLFEKNQTAPVYAGTQTTFKLTGGVKTDTTFFLVAMVSGNPSGDQPQAGYQPIYLFDALTVTITNPDLTPNSANIAGTLGVTGQTTLGNASVTGALGVTGVSTLGTANVTGALGVTGTTNLSSAILSGTLGVTGNTTLSSATVNNTLGVMGSATLRGGVNATASPITMMTGAQSINPGSYVARTDGFIIGVVNAPPGDYSDLCVCWIYGSNYTDGISVQATGGNQGAFNNDWTKWRTSNPNSFVLPVRNGCSWGVGVQQMNGNEVSAPTFFYWVPLGTAAGGQTFERVSDVQPHFDTGADHRRPLPSDAKVRELVEVIEEILDKTIERQLKKRLLSVLMQLQVEDYVVEDEGPPADRT